MWSAFPAFFFAVGVLPRAFWPELLIGIAVSFAWAVGLWYARVWPAGDAKLFILLALFLPYGKNLSPARAVLDQAVNIFVLAAGGYILERIFLGLKNKTLLPWAVSVFRSWSSFSWSRVWPGLVLIYAAAVFLTRLLVLFNFSPIVSVIAAFGLSGQLSRVSSKMKRSLILACSCFCLLGFFLASRPVPPEILIAAFVKILLQGLMVRLGFWVLDLLIRQGDVILVSARDIRPRQVLADSFLKRLGPDGAGISGNLGLLYPDGLLPNQAAIIRNWSMENKVETVEIHSAEAFTFWLFLGTAATWVLRQDLVGILLRRVPG